MPAPGSTLGMGSTSYNANSNHSHRSNPLSPSSAPNQYTETYSRILPLSIRTGNGQDPLSTTNNTTNSFFGSSSRPTTASATATTTISNNNNNVLLSSTVTNVRVSLTYPTSTLLATSCSSNNRQIRLTLTNDSDPLFYFHLLITEQDYPCLKQQQGLLVDFINFPAQLMGLLDKCLDDKFLLVLKYSVNTSSSGSYYGRGGGDSHSAAGAGYCTVLDIVESNPFKYLSHLSLTISPGSDLEVKTYLSELTIQLKQENENLHLKFQNLHSSLESELTKEKLELEKKNQEIASLKEEMFKESTNNLEKYLRELGQEKEKLALFQNELIRKLTAEKNEMERNLRETISTLESKLNTSDTEKSKLHQTIQLNSTKLQSTESKIKSAEDDIKLLNHELQSLKKTNTKLDNDYHEKQRSVSTLLTKLNSFEIELVEKSSLITRQQELIASLGDKCRAYEEKQGQILKELDTIKSQYKLTSADLLKGNEIIKKMQEDGRQLSKQLKHAQNTVQLKDTELKETTIQLDENKKNFELIQRKQVEFEKEREEIKERMEQLQIENDSYKEQINTKEIMIGWLNKQLNQSHGITSLSQFRERLAAAGGTGLGTASAAAAGTSLPALGSTSLQLGSTLNESVPGLGTGGTGTAGRLSKSFDPMLLNNSNNPAPPSNVPSWMNLYSNNTGRSHSALFPAAAPLPSTVAANTITGFERTLETVDEEKSKTTTDNTVKPARKAISAPAAQTRQATWAKPSKKVTLQVGAAQPNWKL